MSQYDAFAAEFEAHARDSPYNAYYDRPAVLKLLGDVRGRRVLDAGCGPGFYAEELVRRGADVVAFDLVISTVHPTFDWRNLGGSYFTDEVLEETWRGNWQVRYRRAPLEQWCAAFVSAGFVIERLVEPRPIPAMQQRYPQDYARLTTEPAFIAFSLAHT